MHKLFLCHVSSHLTAINFFNSVYMYLINTLQSLIISLNDVSDIYISMNKLFTSHVIFYDLEGQRSEGLECFII